MPLSAHHVHLRRTKIAHFLPHCLFLALVLHLTDVLWCRSIHLHLNLYRAVTLVGWLADHFKYKVSLSSTDLTSRAILLKIIGWR